LGSVGFNIVARHLIEWFDKAIGQIKVVNAPETSL
jgi:hypothetical protein